MRPKYLVFLLVFCLCTVQALMTAGCAPRSRQGLGPQPPYQSDDPQSNNNGLPANTSDTDDDLVDQGPDGLFAETGGTNAQHVPYTLFDQQNPRQQFRQKIPETPQNQSLSDLVKDASVIQFPQNLKVLQPKQPQPTILTPSLPPLPLAPIPIPPKLRTRPDYKSEVPPPQLPQSPQSQKPPQVSQTKPATTSSINDSSNDMSLKLKLKDDKSPEVTFSGPIERKDDGTYQATLKDKTGNHPNLTVEAQCISDDCESVDAEMKDQSNGSETEIILSKEVQRLEVELPDEGHDISKYDPKVRKFLQKMTAPQGGDFDVHITEVKWGRSLAKYAEKNPIKGLAPLLIAADLLDTSQDCAPAAASGFIAQYGKFCLVGNSEHGEMVFQFQGNEDAVRKHLVPDSFLLRTWIMPQSHPTPQTQAKPPTQQSQQPQQQQAPVVAPPKNPSTDRKLRLEEKFLNSCNEDLVNKTANGFWLRNPRHSPSGKYQTRYEVLMRFIAHFFDHANETFETMLRVLGDGQLPKEFSFVSLTESDFHCDAVNHTSGAAGCWQLMPDTARFEGLQVSGYQDQRTQIEPSTRAATDQLNQLLDRYQERVPFALAGYNLGVPHLEKRLQPARRAFGALLSKPAEEIASHYRDFANYWTLVRNHMLNLPKETYNYVPRVFSSACIANFPTKYNLNIPPIK